MAGRICIKNTTDSPYTIEEVGGVVIAPDEEYELVGDGEGRYGDYADAKRMLTECENAALPQAVASGDIVIVADVPGGDL